MLDEWKIKCLVPDLPSAEEVLPFLKRMDKERWYSNFGPLVREFEAGMSDFINAMSPRTEEPAHAITFSSATTALEILLRVSGLPQGARILTPALTFSATAGAIRLTGHEPVFTDVDPVTWDLTPALARAAAQHSKIDAVMPVAIYGYPLEMQAWADFQSETGIPVFIDAAAALGNQQVHPDIPVCFSLHATKPFGVGEGGLLVTGHEGLAERARRLTNFAFVDGTSREVGTNAKMAEAMAAYGLSQLTRFANVQKRRKAVLGYYVDAFGLERFHPATAHFVPGTLLLDTMGKAQEVGTALEAAAIQVRKWYFPPLDEHAAYAGAEVIRAAGGASLPVIRDLKKRLIGLPFHAFLDEGDVHRVASTAKNVLS